jgi:hypothetical protein
MPGCRRIAETCEVIGSGTRLLSLLINPVKRRTRRHRRPRQDMSLQLFAARLNIFTVRVVVKLIFLLLPADAAPDDYDFGMILGRIFKPALMASDRCLRSKETNWMAPRSDAAAT